MKAKASKPKTLKKAETNGHAPGGIEEVTRLTRAEVLTAATMDRMEVTSLVGMYYSIQKARIQASNKKSAHDRCTDVLSDPLIIKALKEQLEKLENDAGRSLRAYAREQPLGRWCMTNIGVGPIITAGLLAHIDLERAVTAGAIWKFAGLDPTIKWEKNTRRPYNAALKVICWRLGESFKRTSLRDNSFYGKLYRQRKELEVARNEAGKNADQARAILEEAVKGRRRISAEQRDCWKSGKLQAVGVDRRAARYAVKIFLSHYHTVGREMLGLPVVAPWVIAHGGHSHYIPPPNWPMKTEAEAGEGE